MNLIKNLIQKTLATKGYRIIAANQKLNDAQSYLKYYTQDVIDQKRFYNIGAGGFNHTNWTNIDYDSEWYSQFDKNRKDGINYDLLSLKPLPIKTESAEIVYTSHTLEHITDKAVQLVLDESLFSM